MWLLLKPGFHFNTSGNAKEEPPNFVSGEGVSPLSLRFIALLCPSVLPLPCAKPLTRRRIYRLSSAAKDLSPSAAIYGSCPHRRKQSGGGALLIRRPPPSAVGDNAVGYNAVGDNAL